MDITINPMCYFINDIANTLKSDNKNEVIQLATKVVSDRKIQILASQTFFHANAQVKAVVRRNLSLIESYVNPVNATRQILKQKKLSDREYQLFVWSGGCRYIKKHNHTYRFIRKKGLEAKLYWLAQKIVLSGNQELLEQARQEGVKLYIPKKTPLIALAIKNRHFSLIPYLVEKGCPIEVYDKNKRSFLYKAVASGNFEAVKYFISYLDVNQSDYFGMTPLHIAIKKGYIDITRFLIEKGADLTKKNIYGQSPFHLASVFFIKQFFVKYRWLQQIKADDKDIFLNKVISFSKAPIGDLLQLAFFLQNPDLVRDLFSSFSKEEKKKWILYLKEKFQMDKVVPFIEEICFYASLEPIKMCVDLIEENVEKEGYKKLVPFFQKQPFAEELKDKIELLKAMIEGLEEKIEDGEIKKADKEKMCQQLSVIYQALEKNDDIDQRRVCLINLAKSSLLCYGGQKTEIDFQYEVLVKGNPLSLEEKLKTFFFFLAKGQVEKIIYAFYFNCEHKANLYQGIMCFLGLTSFDDVHYDEFAKGKDNVSRFYRLWTPSLLIDSFLEDLEVSQEYFSKDLIVDWFKTHMPKKWEMLLSKQDRDTVVNDYLSKEVFDMKTGKIKRLACYHLLSFFGFLKPAIFLDENHIESN